MLNFVIVLKLFPLLGLGQIDDIFLQILANAYPSRQVERRRALLCLALIDGKTARHLVRVRYLANAPALPLLLGGYQDGVVGAGFVLCRPNYRSGSFRFSKCLVST